MSSNHYDVLEVSPKASAEVIRAAYKSLMQRHHPDKSDDPAAAVERAAQISRAYDVLSQPAQRAAYDASLAQSAQPAQAAPSAQVSPGLAVPVGAAVGRARRAPARRSGAHWYAWLLILCIVGSGALTWQMGRKAARASLPAEGVVRGAERALPPPSAAALSVAPGVAGPQLVARFVLDMRVSLVGDGSQVATRELLIPELGLRVGSDQPGHWVQEIEAQRAPLIRRILERLGRLGYADLLQPDADALVQRQIEDAVCETIGLDRYGPPVVGGPPPAQQIQALLPQRFSVR